MFNFYFNNCADNLHLSLSIVFSFLLQYSLHTIHKYMVSTEPLKQQLVSAISALNKIYTYTCLRLISPKSVRVDGLLYFIDVDRSPVLRTSSGHFGRLILPTTIFYIPTVKEAPLLQHYCFANNSQNFIVVLVFFRCR